MSCVEHLIWPKKAVRKKGTATTMLVSTTPQAEITACRAIDPRLLYQEANYKGKGGLWWGGEESLPLLHLVYIMHVVGLLCNYVTDWKYWY